MNYLMHLYLSDPEPMVRLGNLMGDFVKGRLEDIPYPPEIIKGLRQHRQVDSFSQHSPIVKFSKDRLDARFGYFRSILIDVFYDHFLARNWERHAATSLETFADSTYRLLREHHAILPAGMRDVAARMIQYNWLVSYREIEVMQRALERIGQRLSRANPLAEGYGELLQHYHELEDDCTRFIAAARAHLDKRPI